MPLVYDNPNVSPPNPGTAPGITVTPAPPAPPGNALVITTTMLAGAALGVAYSQTVQAANGVQPYTFTITAGALPTGLMLAPTGVISGTPTAAITSTFVVQVTDHAGATASAAFTVGAPVYPQIANLTVPRGTVGSAYRVYLYGKYGAQPYGFRVISGNLPPGLTLASTGGITGTPTTAGRYAFTVEIYDSNSPQGESLSAFSILIGDAVFVNPITALDEVMLIAGVDGGVYAVTPGIFHDTDYSGNPVAFLQRWQGVPSSSAKMGLLQLGGATVSAKGNGLVNVTAIADDGSTAGMSSNLRTLQLGIVESKRDFPVFGRVPHSERYGIAFDNGAIADAWFEVHTAILWVREFFSGRKA